MKTRRVVGIAFIVSVGTLIASSLNESQALPSMRQFLGLGLAFTLLSIGADFDVEAAQGFALIVMAVTILEHGENALNEIGLQGAFDTMGKAAPSARMSVTKSRPPARAQARKN